MIWSTIRRGAAVLFAFFVAVAAGALVLFAAGTRWAAGEVTSQMQNPDDVSRALGEGLGAIAFFLTVAPVLSLLPALLVVIIGEIGRIRSVLYYVAGCGIAAAAMPLIAAQTTTERLAYSAPYFSILATAGFAAGLIYWLIAGRRA